MEKQKTVEINSIKINNNLPFVLIAGPCVIESKEVCFQVASFLKKTCKELEIPYIFKSSYDKANRSSLNSFRGVGLKKGLEILRELKEQLNISILTDVHKENEVEEVANVADIIQIPAFLCRQTDLILAAGKTAKCVNVKKGQFISPDEMRNIIEKVESTGNSNILLTERGTCFGYNNLVVDFRSLVIMKRTGYPVIFDVTHSLQKPGGQGDKSGGEPEFVPSLASAGLAIGIAGIFIEVHPEPAKALSDGASMVNLQEIPTLLKELKSIDIIIKKRGQATFSQSGEEIKK